MKTEIKVTLHKLYILVDNVISHGFLVNNSENTMCKLNRYSSKVMGEDPGFSWLEWVHTSKGEWLGRTIYTIQ